MCLLNYVLYWVGFIWRALRETQKRVIVLEEDKEEQPRADKKVTRSLSDLQERLVRILECPVCMEIMRIPILQCSSGHSICSNCIKRVSLCPLCKTSVCNPLRNISLEKISEEVAMPCPNNKHGCQDIVFGKWDLHLNCCPFKEYYCPISQGIGMHCFWKGPHTRFIEHAWEAHPQATLTGNNIPCMLEFKTMYGLDVKFWQCKGGVFIYYTQYIKCQRKVSFAVQYAGPSETASKFAYQLTFASTTKSTNFIYSREVNKLDDDIISLFNTNDCITITEQTMKSFIAPSNKFKFRGNLSIICV